MKGVKPHEILSKIQTLPEYNCVCKVCNKQFDSLKKVSCCSNTCCKILRRRKNQGKFLKSIGVPDRYCNIKMQYDKEVKKNSGLFIYFYGHDKGAGKTHTAVQKLYWELTKDNVLRTGAFINSLRFYSMLKKSLSENNPEKILNKYACKDVLLIDDFGTERVSWFISEYMYDLIDRRSNNCLMTILTSNKSIREYLESYPETDKGLWEIGDRIASRISEGQQKKVTGKDRRLQL